MPVEIHPLAIHLVESRLREIGATEVTLRLAVAKDGPVITESGHFVLDTRFSSIEPDLERRIRHIPGVIESGLFIGYPVTIVTPTREFDGALPADTPARHSP